MVILVLDFLPLAYASPLHMIRYFGTEDLAEDHDFRRLQKKFLAEFNLQGNTFLEINSRSYSKDDILKSLEGLRSDSHMALHEAIFNHKEALLFFEDPKASVSIDELLPFFDTVKFTKNYEYFQKLVEEALQERFKECLFHHHYKEYVQYAVITSYLELFQRLRLYELVHQHVRNLVYFLSSYHDKSFRAFNFEVKLTHDTRFVYDTYFQKFLNGLPDEFDELTQSLAKALVKFIQYCFDHYQLSSAFYYRFIESMLQIDVLDSHIKSELYHLKRRLIALEDQLKAPKTPPVRITKQEEVYEPAPTVAMSEERRRQLKKNLDRETFEVRLMNLSLVFMVVFITIAFLFAWFEKLATLFILVAAFFLLLSVIVWIKRKIFK